MEVSCSGFWTARRYTSASLYSLFLRSACGETVLRSPLLTQLRMVPGLTMMPHWRRSLRSSVWVPVMLLFRSFFLRVSRMSATG